MKPAKPKAWQKAAILACSLIIVSCGGGDGGNSNDSSGTGGGSGGGSGGGTNTHEAVTSQFSSTKGGVLKTSNGVKLSVDPAAIPDNTDGTPVPVTFSIESVETPPLALPSDIHQIGGMEKFGPDGFSFAWPLTTTLPLATTDEEDMQGTQYLQYDPANSRWVRLPAFAYETDDAGKIIGASASGYNLGYAVMAKKGVSNKARQAQTSDHSDGAMKWGQKSCGSEATGTDLGCDYYFVAKSYKPKSESEREGFQYVLELDRLSRDSILECAWDTATQKFSGRICSVLKTGNNSDNSPSDETIFDIMQGEWEFCVTKSQWALPGAPLPLPGKWTYNKLVPVNIARGSHNTCLTNQCWDNVVPIQLPNGGSWLEPAVMPSCPTNNTPTVPVGTGKFQATLTWINTEDKYADLDLHLYGPNGEHVYYQDKPSPDGAFKLDRDWREEPGSAVENIFSLPQGVPTQGDYRLTVKHFSGAVPIDFSVRVINNGIAKTQRYTFQNDDEEIEITTFSE